MTSYNIILIDKKLNKTLTLVVGTKRKTKSNILKNITTDSVSNVISDYLDKYSPETWEHDWSYDGKRKVLKLDENRIEVGYTLTNS